MSFRKRLKQEMLHKNLSKQRTKNIAKIYAVNEDKTVDIIWRDNYTSAEQYAYNLSFPDDDLGFYGGDVEEGDLVEINFLGSNKNKPYICSLRSQLREKNFTNKMGAGLPRFYNV